MNTTLAFNLPHETPSGCLAAKEMKMAKSVAKKAAKKSVKTAKATKTAKPVAEKAPNPVHTALIKLMLRPEGAGIADFQKVEGFNIPSMAALRIAERAGYKTSAVKKPGERTIYKAVKAA
jgi:hypothetical protein